MNIFIFSDLDRTILPNGPQPESSMARPLLRKMSALHGVKLAYVSGRGKSLIQEAIEQYQLPVPDFAVGDVGTTIYRIDASGWHVMPEWQQDIAQAWQGKTAADLASLLADLNFLVLQEPEKQNKFKISYYIDPTADHGKFHELVSHRLAGRGIKAEIICSIDECEGRAFLDILPENATKLHAVRFLLDHLNMAAQRAVFCGDSGNDLPVLASEIQAVLTANATGQVRDDAIRLAGAAGHADKLYLAKGYGPMNGNYSAGVLEGAAHFFPEAAEWLDKELNISN